MGWGRPWAPLPRWIGRAGLWCLLLATLFGAVGVPPAGRSVDARAAAAAPPADPAPSASSLRSGVVLAKFKRGAASYGETERYRAMATGEVAPGFGVVEIPVPPGREREVVAQLRADPSVEYAVPDFYWEIALGVPNDTAYYNAEDPTFEADHIQRQYILTRPQIPEAWDLARGTSDMKIAVIDTGVDLDQPDLAGRLVGGANYVPGEEGRSADDRNGHGTGVAGILVANTNNGKYTAGINWKASVIPIKAFNDQGRASTGPIVRSLQYASEQGARIINMSAVMAENPPPADQALLLDAIKTYVFDRNALMVVAMGNYGRTGRRFDPLMPAVIPGMAAVGATSYRFADDKGNVLPEAQRSEPLSEISNRGSWISVVAPGENVIVLYPRVEPGCDEREPLCGTEGFRGWRFASGTSFATPVVSGVASLVWGCHPTLPYSTVHWAIQQSADKVGSEPYVDGRNSLYGYGRVNALKALKFADTIGRVGAALMPLQARHRVFIPVSYRRANSEGGLPC